MARQHARRIPHHPGRGGIQRLQAALRGGAVQHSFRTLVSLVCLLALAGCSGGTDGSADGMQVKVNSGFQWPPPAPEGTEVALAANPLATNYYVIMDGSGSMLDAQCVSRGTKIDEAKAALAEFANAMPDDANLGLLTFDSAGVWERLPLGAGQKTTLIERVTQVVADQGTPLKTAIQYGYQALTKQALAQRGYGEYNLVIVTDGEASPGEDPTE